MQGPHDSVECRSADELAAFAAGALDEGDAARLELHVDLCARCRRILSALGATAGDEGGLPPGAERSHGAGFAAGQRLGRFTLLRVLGRGAMGEVWAAHDPELDREVAIKRISLSPAVLDQHASARLRREAQAMARLSHPHVVRIYELGSEGDLVFCAMELVDGMTLRSWLLTPRRWPEILEILLAAGRGVAAAHAAGLVHRDVKPDNILIARDGRTLVTDFGVAKLVHLGEGETLSGRRGVERVDELTRSGGLVGTPAFMPLEQLEGGVVDATSDQFSFCVTAYQALFGTRPFVATTLTGLVEAVRRGPTSAGHRHDVPRALERCILRGLAADKAARWPSMDALLAALARTAAAPRRRRRLALAAVAALTLAGAGVAVAYVSDGEAHARAAARGRMDRAWSPARRAVVHAAFARSGNPAQGSLEAAVVRALDAYRAEWLAMRLDAWSATHLRGEQSQGRLEQRVVCLDRLADELDTFVTLLGSADRPEWVARAPDGAYRLTPVAACADPQRLDGLAARLGGPLAPATVAAVESELASLRAFGLAGRHDEALARASKLVAQTEGLDEPRLLAPAVYVLGVAQAQKGDFAAAETTLRRAVQEAARARDHRLVAEAWNRLLEVVGLKLRRPDDALPLEPAARAAVAQAGEDAFLRADLSFMLGTIQYARGRFAEGRDHFAQARDGFVAARGPEHPYVADAEASLGGSLVQLGKLDEALPHLERARAIARAAYGDAHPVIGTVLQNLAALSGRRADWPAVLRYAQEAVEVRARVLGPDHAATAQSRTTMARALRKLGQHDEARVQLEYAQASLERTLRSTHPDVASVQLARGALAEAQGRLAEAEALDERAVASLRKELPPEHPQLAYGLAELARVKAPRAPLEALALYDEAMGIVTAKQPRDPSGDVDTLAEIGETALAAGVPGRGLAWFDRLPEAGARLPELRRRLERARRRRT